MPKPTYLYSTHARWYVCVCSPPADRAAVVVQTASRGDCFATLPPDLTRDEQFAAAAEIVASFYDQEDWYRLPNEIRCREAALTEALRGIFDHVPVRTDRASRSFVDIEARFIDQAA